MVRAILPTPMSLSTLWPRALAAPLAVSWLTIAVLLLQGSADAWLAQLLLAFGALVPAVICFTILARPAPQPGAGATLALWAALGSLLLTLPLTALLAEPLLVGRAQLSLPSTVLTYAGFAALIATALYAALARGGSPGSVRAIALLAGLAGVVSLAGMVSGGSAAGVPAGCTLPGLSATAVVSIEGRAMMDGTLLASATIDGRRNGRDERWSGRHESTLSADFAADYVVVGGRAWLKQSGGEWLPAPAESGPERRIAEYLGGRSLAAADDLGLEVLDGGPARHCRLAIDGDAALEVLPALAWLVGSGPMERTSKLGLWQGELDWWLGNGGALSRAEVYVGGHPTDAWGLPGLRGSLWAELALAVPQAPEQISEPLP